MLSGEVLSFSAAVAVCSISCVYPAKKNEHCYYSLIRDTPTMSVLLFYVVEVGEAWMGEVWSPSQRGSDT